MLVDDGIQHVDAIINSVFVTSVTTTTSVTITTTITTTRYCSPWSHTLSSTNAMSGSVL